MEKDEKDVDICGDIELVEKDQSDLAQDQIPKNMSQKDINEYLNSILNEEIKIESSSIERKIIKRFISAFKKRKDLINEKTSLETKLSELKRIIQQTTGFIDANVGLLIEEESQRRKK